MTPVLDTNILIDYLNGVDAARAEIELYESARISIITQIEVLVGAASEEEEDVMRSFLQRFNVEAVGEVISNRAIELRRNLGLKIPDAIVYATAKMHGSLLVTRNTRDFHPGSPDIRCPYKL